MPTALLDAPTKTCPECGDPVTRPRATYCSRYCLGRVTSRAQRQRGYHRSANYRVTVPCAWCGTPLLRDPRSIAAGHQPHCDNLCAAATRFAREKAERHTRGVQNILANTTPRAITAAPLPHRRCPACDTTFTPTHREQRWCRRQCYKASRRRPISRFVTARCDCGEWVTVDSRAGYSAAIAYCSDACARRVRHRRRRARERSAYDEHVSAVLVFERDGWLCHLCGDLCDGRAGPVWRPWAATLDHVIPLARGGRHSYANIRTAHAICNSLKSDQALFTVSE